jgi:hypothetical protein
MNSVRSKRLKWLLALLAALTAARAAMYAVPFLFRTGPMPFPKAPPEAVERFRDAKFGLFIHWGPASITGKEIGWSRGAERPRIGGKGDVPVEVYDNLYKAFNPTSFDARQWVALAQSAGMRYLVFTAKHHDGFCMFDSSIRSANGPRASARASSAPARDRSSPLRGVHARAAARAGTSTCSIGPRAPSSWRRPTMHRCVGQY